VRLLGFTAARMCGGPYQRGAFVRRIPRGLVFDWFGIGIWKD